MCSESDNEVPRLIARLGYTESRHRTEWDDSRAGSSDGKETRDYAVSALVRIGQPAVPLLIGALGAESSLVRENAARALGGIGDPRAVEPLVGAMVGALADDGVAYRAAEAVGRIGDPRAVEPLISALAGQNQTVRRLAVEVLGQIGDPRAVEPLIGALADQHPDVRRAAANALRNMAALAFMPVIDALADQDRNVRQSAVAILGDIASPWGDRRRSAQAIEPLIGALADQDPGVRRESARILGSVGEQRAVEPLISALADQSREVRAAAAESLGRIGDQRAVGPLIDSLAEDGKVCEKARDALTQIGFEQNTVNQLINALRVPSPETQRRQVQYLLERASGVFSSERAGPGEWIMNRRQSSRWGVTPAQAAALKKKARSEG